ncbi:hypothetical protein DI272_01585 [Streptomyces sp. Act143]|uniref:hypothetical protein n=1 Tax=Streptomyces sp. Act143 TaxID=2200760 RepID=UPI000D673506|nr:hypothetical protein [Streptomyces sp. Act143]PWI20253.1 hypothetical protein DI272_01585 [Streptomyces sp. Act143]
MNAEPPSIGALITGKAFMADVGAYFPVSMALRGDVFEAVFMMREGDLGHRTRGPYSPEQPPHDAIGWVQLRTGMGMAGRFPSFRVEAGGHWPRIHVALSGTSVRGLIVMPEEVTAEAVNAPYLGKWQDQACADIRIGLDYLAEWLASCHHEAGGTAPSIDLDLVYRPFDYEASLARYDLRMRELIPPVRPVLELRWRSATPAQRRAFVKKLKGARKSGSRLDRRWNYRLGGIEVEVPR